MATEKFVAGTVGLTYTTAGFGAEVNSLATGNTVMAGTQLDNSANLDVFCDVSVSLGSVTPSVTGPFVGIYLFPLNEDGTTYGNGQFSTVAVAAQPSSPYYAGTISLTTSAGVLTGVIRGIIMPPDKFKFGIYNATGVSLAASANTIDYRTYNRQVA
jgi:hypothetical protein